MMTVPHGSRRSASARLGPADQLAGLGRDHPVSCWSRSLHLVPFQHEPGRLIASLVPVLAVFLVICAKTTRGGWKWRNGKDD